MDREVKQYGKFQAKAGKHYGNYKKTGNEKELNKAREYYGYRDALGIKLENPGTKVDIKQTTIKDSFKSSKQVTYGIHQPKTAIKTQKKVVKK